MAAINPIREALTSGRFSYMVELVAGAKTTEEQAGRDRGGLMQVPGVLAGSVTSYAGGSAGHDPIRIGAMMQARGLTPNIHLTCVGRDRLNIGNALAELQTLGIENVFAITGDFPKGSKETAETLYDLDSVQLVEMINEVRQANGLSVLYLCRGFAVQIHRSRLRLSVSQAREEDRRRRGLRDHPARLRFAQDARAEAIYG